MHRYEQLIRRYFDACNAADYAELVSCFTPDAVHYFPPGLPDVPFKGADTIARKWIWCVEQLGSCWTIDKVLIGTDSPEAVIEWTHWKRKLGIALRGDEWYVFDPDSGLIAEIRAFYATPAVTDPTLLPQVGEFRMDQLVGFDYAGRGYHVAPPSD